MKISSVDCRGADGIGSVRAKSKAVAGRFATIHREHAGCIASDLEKAAAGDAAVGHGKCRGATSIRSQLELICNFDFTTRHGCRHGRVLASKIGTAVNVDFSGIHAQISGASVAIGFCRKLQISARP